MSGTFSDLAILQTIVGKVPWTLALSLVAFLGGAVVAALLTLAAILGGRYAASLVSAITVLVQSTPLLMVIFLCFFGLPLIGVDVSPWLASSLALIAFAGAFLTEIWRSAIRAVPSGQWEASQASGLSRLQALWHVVLPQSIQIAIPPTVGFSVQVVKATALTSIVGFVEVTRAGYVLNNVTFKPFFIFCVVGLVYMAINLPLSVTASKLERHFASK